MLVSLYLEQGLLFIETTKHVLNLPTNDTAFFKLAYLESISVTVMLLASSRGALLIYFCRLYPYTCT